MLDDGQLLSYSESFQELEADTHAIQRKFESILHQHVKLADHLHHVQKDIKNLKKTFQ